MGFKQYNEDGHYEEVTIDADTGQPSLPKGKEKKPGAAAEVMAVFALFDNPAKGIWHLRPLERASAKVLHDTYGLPTLEKRLARIKIEREKKDPYFPDANTPSQLLDKMPNIERYLGV